MEDIKIFVEWGTSTGDWFVDCYYGEEYLEDDRVVVDTKAEAMKEVTRLKKQYFKQGYQYVWAIVGSVHSLDVQRKKYKNKLYKSIRPDKPKLTILNEQAILDLAQKVEVK
tara:strand:- start:88 stop:420 length:333 start_codon:yes stop_codon:yes gene_type:complete